jgi:cytochrome c peroxidase
MLVTSLNTLMSLVRLRLVPVRATLCALLLFNLAACQQADLSDREKKRLLSLSLATLQAPRDPSNRYADNTDAQRLGESLFFDKRLSSNNEVSCATCHIPEKSFTDGLARAQAQFETDPDYPALRNTPTVIGSAWQTWQYWDGRRDSLWSQALTPIEAPTEMAGNRVAVARLVLSDNDYRTQYETIFGPLPYNTAQLPYDATPMGTQDAKRHWYQVSKPMQTKINQTFANVGKALAAYQSTLRPPVTRFDRFAEQLAAGESYTDVLSKLEYQGARLFVNEKKTQCLECHNGPLLSNGDFHNIGSATFTGDQIDFGRILGVQSAMIDEFNCHGRYSDAEARDCTHLNFMNQSDFVHTQGGFRTPTLRGVADTAPYFHDGRFTDLRQVIQHYTTAVSTEQPTELRQFPLSDKETDALQAFLKTLSPE